MSKLHFTTKHLNEATVERNWHIVDASNKVLGRMSSKIASILMGKHKPSFSNHIDAGDYVIVINADKVKLTGDKWDKKIYIHHTGYPGGQKHNKAGDVLSKKPNFIIETAVKGMLPKNRLGRKMYKKMFVYTGAEHPHQAQQPITLAL